MNSVNPRGSGQEHVANQRDEPAIVADMMGSLLKQVSRIIASEERWGGLRASHYRLLCAVPPGGIRMTELGERLGMTTQASGQFVGFLVDTGHLSVEVDQADRRSRRVVRTRRGDRTVGGITERIARIEDKWAEQVGAKRYAVFRAVLAELAQR
ncbi:MAG: hypothetical protein QOF27_1733 [Gaiellaceae bacterium]|jgi:DNA-binding MarR family transcriptional regulator|nr:hypothetical protein [Gaiellaceae bacterium]